MFFPDDVNYEVGSLAQGKHSMNSFRRYYHAAASITTETLLGTRHNHSFIYLRAKPA